MKNSKFTKEEIDAQKLNQQTRILLESNGELEDTENPLSSLSSQILSILEPNMDAIQTQQNTPFYIAEQNILQKIDPTRYVYYSFLQNFSNFIKTKEYDKNKLNSHIKYNIFAPSIESSEDYKKELKERLKNDVAIVYTACIDHGILLSDSKLLPDMLSQDITEILGEYDIFSLKGNDIIMEM